jgi:hypothetical protein
VISRALRIILIAFAIFAYTILLGLNYNPIYAYFPCNCVIFAMDDIADYGGIKVQLATTDYFISKNLPFRASIVARDLANGSSWILDGTKKEGDGRKAYRGTQLISERFPLLMAEGNKPGVPHTPFWASASCKTRLFATSTITTPSRASAASTAITTNVVFISKP